jgi:hypothetical protein
MYSHVRDHIWRNDRRGPHMGTTTRHRQARVVIWPRGGQRVPDGVQHYSTDYLYTDEEMGTLTTRRRESANDASYTQSLNIKHYLDTVV